jgi:2-(3-amino-3-carboxypropyl)histidine synthase
MKKTIEEIQEEYDLELNRVLIEIKKIKAKLVLLQFPDGLKPYATAVVDYLKEKTNNKIEFLIWLGSCYGACDTPVLSQKIEKQVDLTIQFGHSGMMPEKQ